MATPSEKLAESLEILKEIQDNGIIAIHTGQLTRTHRERLADNGFIKEVYQGWYIIASPEELKGDSTSWYSSYWTFCSQFLNYKYKENWCISPEQSLMLHAGNLSVPKQLVIKSPEANNFKTDLPYRTSLFHMKSPLSLNSEIIVQDGVRMLTLPIALINASPNTFTKNSTEARTFIISTTFKIIKIKTRYHGNSIRKTSRIFRNP